MATDLSMTSEVPALDCHVVSICSDSSQTLLTSTPTGTDASPMIYSANIVSPVMDQYVGESQICRWKGCGQVFHALEALVNHIHDVHVKLDSSEIYRCQWEGCPRNGKGFNAR
jgi:hypothetical protein